MKKNNAHERILKTRESFENQLLAQFDLSKCTVQNLDLRGLELDWASIKMDHTVFLGCLFDDGTVSEIKQKGGLVFPKIYNLPYEPYRTSLYTPHELLKGYNSPNTISNDQLIYEHFKESRYNPGILEALAQRIHDHAIDDALRLLLDYNPDGMTKKRTIGIMGGHSTLRTDPFYKTTAFTARKLAKKSYFIASGGGPGIMEAANLGAYFADRPEEDLEDAIEILSQVPFYSQKSLPTNHPHNQQMFFDYLEVAQQVLNKYPGGVENLAIPTWFYGHEPSNLFATHVAKYFSNSIREDNLLAISLYGVIFAPGSAGTLQEVFMDTAQNHYATFDFYSPMVFLGCKHYEKIFSFLKEFSGDRAYSRLLHLCDTTDDAINFIANNGPVRKA